MSHTHAEFDPNCEGCRPALLDPRTGQKLPSDDPMMVMVNELWDAAPREEQEACFRVWVHNSRAAKDMDLMGSFQRKIQEKLASV